MHPKIVGGLFGYALGLWVSALSAANVLVQLPPETQGLEGLVQRATSSFETVANERATPQDILAAARADYGRISAALYAAGYYGGVISILVDGREAADISPLTHVDTIKQILIRVRPGPLFTFSETTVAPLAQDTEMPEGFVSGKPALSGLIKDAARAGTDGWRDAGHAKVKLKRQDITADHRNSTLGTRITLQPGPKLSFGNLNVTYSGSVRPERIVEIAGLPTGEIYSPEHLQDTSDRLRRTGVFSSVVLRDAENVRPGDVLDIDATLTDQPLHRIGFGAELSSLEGLALNGFWLHRNLFGGAERLRIEGDIEGIGGDSGGVDYRLGFRYDRPATFTPDTNLIIGGRVQQLEEPDYRERSIRFGAGVSHIFSDELKGELGIAYQYSDITDAFGSRQLEHILLPSDLTYDSRDEELDATRGAYAQLDVMPLAGLNNDALGVRVYTDIRSYISFGDDSRFIFATRGQLGSITGARTSEVPPNLLFFSGGAGTVRGQDYQSLGIPVAPGVQVGARSLAAISAEFRVKVKGPWGLVAFADYAKIGAGGFFDTLTDDHAGAGFGVRYHTPLGPIRVDLAAPIGSNAGENFEVYIGIGQAF